MLQAHRATYAYGISGNNIVGYYYDASDVPRLPLQRRNLHHPRFPGQRNSEADGISGNNIVGSYTEAAGNNRLPLQRRAYTTLDDPLGTQGTGANGIDGNNIVGTYNDASGTPRLPLQWRPTRPWTTRWRFR